MNQLSVALLARAFARSSASALGLRKTVMSVGGFEIGGNASNFRKIVAIEQVTDLRAVAREAVAVLCNVLRYDGTFDLKYQLSLQTAYRVDHVLAEVGPETLVKLLREWGFAADLKSKQGEPPLIEARTDHGPFGVLFADKPKENSSNFRTLKLRSFRDVKDGRAQSLANRLNKRYAALTATTESDNGLVLESQVFLHGGVTSNHLRARFELWRWTIGHVAEPERQGQRGSERFEWERDMDTLTTTIKREFLREIVAGRKRLSTAS